MQDDWESEIRRQSFGDRSPCVFMVIAAQQTDIRPRSAGAGPFGPAAMVLHKEPARSIFVSLNLVDTLAKLGIQIGDESRAEHES